MNSSGHCENGLPTGRLRQVVLIVVLANLAYFFVEFVVAQRISSVSLFADSIDFLEDTSVNLLIVIALGWSLRDRARLRMLLAVVLLIPTTALLWTAWNKFPMPAAPAPWLLSATGFGALVVNLACALLLTNYRHHQVRLTRAAFLSARNDTLANLVIIAAGLITLRWMVGLTGPDRGTWDCLEEYGCGERGLAGHSAGTCLGNALDRRFQA